MLSRVIALPAGSGASRAEFQAYALSTRAQDLKNLSKCLWALHHLYVSHMHRSAKDADMRIRGFGTIQTTTLQRHHLKQCTSCPKSILRHLAEDKGFSQSNSLHPI